MSNIANIKVISPLEKIYIEDKIPQKSYERFSMLKNERKSFQIAIESDCESEKTFTIKTDLQNIRTYQVKHIKSDLPMTKTNADDYYRFSKSGYYPDLLSAVSNRVKLCKGITVLWIEIIATDGDVGNHRIEVIIDGAAVGTEVEIINAELDFSDFVYTSWFHTDCLMSYYDFDAFSDEYWRVTENFLKTAFEYGMNCVLTPIFTPPLDTEVGKERPTVQLVDIALENGKYYFDFDRLTRWIEMAERCGIKYFELSHFYTQWGAKSTPKIMATVDGEYKKIFGWETKSGSKSYKKFLKAFADELKCYLEGRNLKDNILIHVSDEPNIGVISSYKRASKYIRSLFEGYKIIDALSDVWFYRLKIVSNPIPANSHIDKFLGKAENLWTYYCSAQKNYYVSNRFFCNESLRTRVLGYQLYKFNIKGFLHWGYNFYYTQLSKKLINPYEVSDAGGKFPSGDSFVVYPGEDGYPEHSVRLKVFFDGLQDMAALRTLEKLTDRNTCINIIEENGKHNITFRKYPHSDEWMLNTRELINSKIKSLL